jgi:hypothetical protein
MKAEKISEVYNKWQKRDLPLALVVRKLEHVVSRFFLNFFVAALNLSLVSNTCCSPARCCQMNRSSEKHLDKCFQGASGISLHIEKTRTPCPTLIQPTPEALATKTTFLCIRYLMFQIWVHCESIWIGKLTHVHIIRPVDEINLLFRQIIIEVSLAIERQHLSKWHSILWNADQDRGEDIEAKAM